MLASWIYIYMYIKNNLNLTLLSEDSAWRAGSACPRDTQGMKDLWAFGLKKLRNI